jgi:hypothetical protein
MAVTSNGGSERLTVPIILVVASGDFISGIISSLIETKVSRPDTVHVNAATHEVDETAMDTRSGCYRCLRCPK